MINNASNHNLEAMSLRSKVSLSQSKRILDLEQLSPAAKFFINPADDCDIPSLGAMLASRISNLRADQSALERVHAHSRSVLAIRNRRGLAGCLAALLLNHKGLRELLSGQLSVGDPNPLDLARPGEQASAIYVWALCLPGVAVAATANLVQWFEQPFYANADFYARPATLKGLAFLIRTGFNPIIGNSGSPLWVYHRQKRLNKTGNVPLHALPHASLI